MGELSRLPNIGEIIEVQLKRVGINTIEELRVVGSKNAWSRIKEIDDTSCIHKLYALEGAIQGIKKNELSIDKKDELKNFCNSFK